MSTTGQTATAREDITFTSGGDLVAAWHYPPATPDAAGTCVVMAHGFSMTRHDGLERYAAPLSAAGAHVVVFDHRYLGDSGGQPRQRFRRAAQLEDWRNAIAFARTIDGVAPGRIVLWGFSFSGGHAITLKLLISVGRVDCPSRATWTSKKRITGYGWAACA